eukprot:9139300-Pyramimonas_sp.AAC.1
MATHRVCGGDGVAAELGAEGTRDAEDTHPMAHHRVEHLWSHPDPEEHISESMEKVHKYCMDAEDARHIAYTDKNNLK